MNRQKNHPVQILLLFLLACLSTVLIAPGLSLAKPGDTETTYKSLEVFSNVLNEIQKNYVEEIDTQEVIDGAIKGMLITLDPHSSFMKPDDFKEMQVETKGSFSGIGIEITIKDSILTVVSPIEDTPAFKVGLKAGDMIIKINGQATKDMSLMDAVKKLRGIKGTEVTVSIHRRGWTELKEFTIIRGVIPLHSVRSKVLEPGYGYVRITNFQANTAKDLKKAMKKLVKEEKLRGLVLDLRNNPGGLLDQSVKVSDLFLNEGVIVSTKGRLQEQNMEFKAHSGGVHYDFPMVILVNEGSASASEIVAGALQDHKRALILGAQTFGKGSVQTIIPMSDGAGLRLTTARYYTPNGTSIQAKGITPDILVPTQATASPHQETKPESPKFLREKDLRHHLKNGDDVQDKKTPRDDKKTETEKKDGSEEKEKEEARKQAELKKDHQLYTALLILKSFSVFNQM